MSTAGSVRSGEQSQYAPPAPPAPPGGAASRSRLAVFRWRGIIPLVLALVVALLTSALFGERIARGTLEEAGTKALGAEFDVADLDIRPFSTTVELRGVVLADPFDRMKNLVEVGRVLVELEPRPLLEKKLVVKRLAISGVRTGTRRTSPARVVSGGGLAPSALAEVRRFAGQFRVPLLSLVPLDSIRALVLDPSQLKSVQAALGVARQTDSVTQALQSSYGSLKLQETLDSSTALLRRLQSADLRTLGVGGVRTAVADVRQAVARVDSARARVEALGRQARAGTELLRAGVGSVDDARREDYSYARGLLRLPSFDAPDIGAALFGPVTIEKFQEAVYWTALARQYAPPGLLPRETQGPKRVRRAGSTVHFATPESYPRFWLRRADVSLTMDAGPGAGSYAMAIRDMTTDPGIVGRPTLFAMRSTGKARGRGLDSLHVTASMDHTHSRPRETVSAAASGVALPPLAVPSLPYVLDPGRGASSMTFTLDGDQLSGRWVVQSANLTWRVDSTRARKLNAIETLVARVLTGVPELELSATVSGTVRQPRLAVRSNLDRQIADRVRAVAGEQIAAAEAKVRSEVDRLVEERTAPLREKVAELRSESERRIADARAKLDSERRQLDERLRTLGGGLTLPRLPGT